jgi:hypothetical protein
MGKDGRFRPDFRMPISCMPMEVCGTVEKRREMTMNRYISADSHVLEPADLWIERMDQPFRDQAPRIVLNPPGFEGEYWLFGDREPVTAVQGFFAGASRDSYDEFPEHLRTARYAERVWPKNRNVPMHRNLRALPHPSLSCSLPLHHPYSRSV